MKARLGLALLAGAVCLAGGGFAADGPPPEQRRRLQHDEEHRFILTVCPHVSLHAAHGELASVGVHPRRNFSRAVVSRPCRSRRETSRVDGTLVSRGTTHWSVGTSRTCYWPIWEM